MVINGSQIVSQRATSSSFSTSTEGFIITDRFAFSMNGTSTVYTASQDSTAPDGFTKSIKLDCTTADSSLSAGDFTQIHYRIEGQDLQLLKKGTSSAEKVTISFYVRSPKTGTHILEIQDRDNTRSISKSYTINTADTFEYKQITFDGDTSGALNDDNGESFRLTWWLQAGSTYTSGTLATSWEATTSANRAVGQVNIGDNVANNFFITGIQMELGSQATPFEHRSFGEELALCQRYCNALLKYGDGNVDDNKIYSATYVLNNGMIRMGIPRMRDEPDPTYSLSAGTITGDFSSNDLIQFWISGSNNFFVYDVLLESEL